MKKKKETKQNSFLQTPPTNPAFVFSENLYYINFADMK